MKKFWLGFVSGIAALSLVLAVAWSVTKGRTTGSTVVLFTYARGAVERALPGARVLDVQVSTYPESAETVNYIHDHLYDVSVVYERAGKVKKIRIPYGLIGRQWVSPRNSDIVVKDDQAEIVRQLSAAPAQP